MLLLIEGKTFDSSDIDSVESKGTRGKVVESKEKATGFLAHLVAWPFALTVLGLPFLFGMTVGGTLGMTPYRYLDDQFSLSGSSMQLAGYKSQIKEANGSTAGQLSNAITQNKIAITLKSVVRHGDILTFVIHVKNSTGNIISGTIDLSGSASGNGPLDFDDTRIGGFSMAADEQKDFNLKVYLPESQSVQMVQGTYQFKNPDADTLYVTQTVLF